MSGTMNAKEFINFCRIGDFRSLAITYFMKNIDTRFDDSIKCYVLKDLSKNYVFNVKDARRNGNALSIELVDFYDGDDPKFGDSAIDNYNGLKQFYDCLDLEFSFIDKNDVRYSFVVGNHYFEGNDARIELHEK